MRVLVSAARFVRALLSTALAKGVNLNAEDVHITAVRAGSVLVESAAR